MNVRKVALFVEGFAELVFVREFLLKWYEWDSAKVGFNCYTLHAGEQCDESYSWGDHDSENYFQILNTGNDNKVLSAMLDRADGFHDAGYTLVVGLRDMFSQDRDEIINRVTRHVSENAGYGRIEKRNCTVVSYGSIMEKMFKKKNLKKN